MKALKLAILSFLGTLAVSCATTAPRTLAIRPKPHEPYVGWWDKSHDYGPYAAVGSMKAIGSQHLVRARAANSARKIISSSLEGEINSIADGWSQELGEIENGPAVAAIMREPAFTQAVLDATMAGAAIKWIESQKEVTHTLVRLKTPPNFLGHLEAKAEQLVHASGETDSATDSITTALESLAPILERRRTSVAEESAQLDQLLSDIQRKHEEMANRFYCGTEF